MAKPIINSLDNKFCELSKRVKDYTGMKFNNWVVLGYKGNQCWLCQCQCENKTLKIVRAYDLINGLTRSCGCTRHEDLTGKRFGNWIVLKYDGDKNWLCQCQCESKTLKLVRGDYLKNGSSTSCGCLQRKYAAEHMKTVAKSRIKDITNTDIGYWKAIEYIGESKWLFRCTVCGSEIICRERDVVAGRKCDVHDAFDKKLIDLTGKKINSWTVIKYAGNKSWECRCECGNTRIIKGQRLRSGDSKSCGCKRKYWFMNSYGYTDEQINKLFDYDEILKIINTKDNGKIKIYELADALDINYQLCIRIIDRLNLKDYIDYNYNNSHIENEVYDFVKSLVDCEVIRNDRQALNGNELDIYVPDKKLAIEFNGTYWHSTEHKDIKYHQEKTLKCFSKNIRLIHIFEHEWIGEKQNILKDIIKSALTDNFEIIYGRNTEIHEIDNDKYKIFLDKYHLQGYAAASIKLGQYYNNELIAVIGIGKPRFNNLYQYELIRYCVNFKYNVIGGFQKIFKYFINNYDPNSIITYTDISKFTGLSYIKAGFKKTSQYITEPNYVWVSADLKTILSRYQTQKNKLVEYGIAYEDQTEDEAMIEHNYYKVYDSGNLKLEWRKTENV